MSEGQIKTNKTYDLMGELINIVSDECEHFKVDEWKTDQIIKELQKDFYSIIYNVIDVAMKDRSVRRRRKSSIVSEFQRG